ncbi:auxin-responsive protein SAUR21-like, partial [Carica papaya]|uniref:auxin-responsive protein SAUR21-like n=1 Tax=Carica papaya TaxID=3649 RepID=UPI000B8CEBA8
MDCKKSNKIREIVRLQQILKKWRKLANTSKAAATSNGDSESNGNNNNNINSGSKSIKFLKRTLSLSDTSVREATSNVVPKGYLAVCVGEEQKRYIIPTQYLSHQAFHILLMEAEEEFG